MTRVNHDMIAATRLEQEKPVTSLFRRILSVSLVASLMFPALSVAQQQAPKEVKGATHGDWQIVCLEGTELCRMEQYGKSPQGERALLVRLQRVTGQEIKAPAVISMLAPPLVLLSFNLRAKIDNGEMKILPFERCLPQGCLAAGPMSDATVADLKKGTKMTVEFILEKRENITVSLRGFTKAYNSLKPIQAKATR